jgi:hypothetical protein
MSWSVISRSTKCQRLRGVVVVFSIVAVPEFVSPCRLAGDVVLCERVSIGGEQGVYLLLRCRREVLLRDERDVL